MAFLRHLQATHRAPDLLLLCSEGPEPLRLSGTTKEAETSKKSPTSATFCRTFDHVNCPNKATFHACNCCSLDSQPPDVTNNTVQGGRRTGADRVNRYTSSVSEDGTMGTGTGRWKVAHCFLPPNGMKIIFLIGVCENSTAPQHAEEA